MENTIRLRAENLIKIDSVVFDTCFSIDSSSSVYGAKGSTLNMK